MTSFRTGPDARGLFGRFGGQFVAETLMPLINSLAAEYEKAKTDPAFFEELTYFHRDFIGRATPLYYAERLSEHFGGAKIYFKREDLNHTGAHKINNCIGQILLAKRMGKKRIIAETGAGMHGVATATVAARFGMQCVVYMGTTDIDRQQANVFRMKLLGAEVVPLGVAPDGFNINRDCGSTAPGRMAELVRGGQSEADLAPMVLVADAFTLGRRNTVADFQF